MAAHDHRSRRPDVEVDFGHDPTAPGRARRAVRSVIREADDPIAASVELVTSELVSNVIQHTDDGGTVRAWDPRPDDPFRVEVTDDEPTVPEPRAVADETGGRGIGIVESLSDAWGVERRTDGKTVWAEFECP